jgi:hypothetical protein
MRPATSADLLACLPDLRLFCIFRRLQVTVRELDVFSLG